jgi:hypothetical protein
MLCARPPSSPPKASTPAGLEDLFGRQIICWFESIADLGSFQVEGNKLALATSPKSTRSLHLDRKIVLKAGQQERSELAFELVNLAPRPIFQTCMKNPCVEWREDNFVPFTPVLNLEHQAVNVRVGEKAYSGYQ